MRTFLKTTTLLALFILTFMVMIGAASAKDTITISYRTPASSMHPHAQRTNTEATIGNSIFDALVDRDPEGKLIPSLATSWELVNPTTWRFHLRKGVKWQNGDPFTAEDVAYTLEVGRNPISRFQFITSKIKEVKILDPHTIDVVTHNPWPLLPDSLYLSLFVMSKNYCSGKTEEYLAKNPMGTGPYVLKEWVRESHVRLQAFDGHWRGPAPIKNVVFKPITNDSTRLAGLITGATDMTIDVPVQYAEFLEKAPKIKVVSMGGPRVIFFSWRMDDPNLPTSKLKVRQAMIMAINEDEIIERLLNGKAVSAIQLPHPFHRGYNPDIVRPPYDPEKAKKLLAEAGYPNGFDIDLYVPNNRYIRDKDIGVAVAQQLSKIGIRVNLIARSYTIHFKELTQKKLNFYMIGWEELTFDSARLVGTFLRSDAKWGWAAPDKKFDGMLEAADQVSDVKLRAEKLKEINKIVADNVWLLPLHYQPNIYGVHEDLNFVANVKKILTLHRMSFKQ
jgi:peptide/nickel transport system substrate-binding protein